MARKAAIAILLLIVGIAFLAGSKFAGDWSVNLSAGAIAEGQKAKSVAEASAIESAANQQALNATQIRNDKNALDEQTRQSRVRMIQILSYGLGIGGGVSVAFGLIFGVLMVLLRYNIWSARQMISPLTMRNGAITAIVNPFARDVMVVAHDDSPSVWTVVQKGMAPVSVAPDSRIAIAGAFGRALQSVARNSGGRLPEGFADSLLNFANQLQQPKSTSLAVIAKPEDEE